LPNLIGFVPGSYSSTITKLDFNLLSTILTFANAFKYWLTQKQHIKEFNLCMSLFLPDMQKLKLPVNQALIIVDKPGGPNG
jgi:hypothetical protein